MHCGWAITLSKQMQISILKGTLSSTNFNTHLHIFKTGEKASL